MPECQSLPIAKAAQCLCWAQVLPLRRKERIMQSRPDLANWTHLEAKGGLAHEHPPGETMRARKPQAGQEGGSTPSSSVLGRASHQCSRRQLPWRAGCP